MSTDGRSTMISLENYIRRAFKTLLDNRSFSNTKFNARISTEAVSKMNIFLNEFIRDVARASIKIAENSNRKTIMEKDIDTVMFTLYHSDIYQLFIREHVELYHENYKDFLKTIKANRTKSRYTLMEKYKLNVPPTRIENIVRLVIDPTRIRISKDAILLLSINVNEIIDFYLAGGLNSVKIKRTVLDPRTRIETIYLGIITWNDILEVEKKYVDIKTSMCKYEKK